MAKAKAAESVVPLKLQGKSIFLGGNFYQQNEAIARLIEFEGGKVVDELTEKTDIMVLGYSAKVGPQKKAVKLNAQGAAIQVFSLEQLYKHMKPTSEEAVPLLRSGPAGVERWNRNCSGTNRYYGTMPTPGKAASIASIRDGDFTKADLTNANLGELVADCDFTNANLTNCVLYLANCRLNGANLDGVAGLNLVACTAEKVDFSRVMTKDVHIEDSNLNGSRFTGLEGRHIHLKNCQLNGADFSGIKAPLSVRLINCSLVKAKFAGAALEPAEFTDSDLSGADFTNASLKLANLRGAKVDGADFTGAAMTSADITGVDFSKAIGFDPARLQAKGGAGPAVTEFLQAARKAQRLETTLTVTKDSTPVELTFQHTSYWSGCFERGANHYLSHYHVQKSAESQWVGMVTRWQEAQPELGSLALRATKASMPNKELKMLALAAWCELFGIQAPDEDALKKAAVSSKAQKRELAEQWLVTLRSGKKGVEQWNENPMENCKTLAKCPGIDLPKAKLNGVKLQKVDWTSANLGGADLAGSELYACRFPEANFAGANLKRADLRYTSLQGAVLENSDASAADLTCASLKRANCKGAVFAKTNLQRADLCGTDFTNADLAGADLARAQYDENTRWPKGFTPPLDMEWKGPGTSPAAHKLVQSTKPKSKLNIEQFMKRLEELTDAGKLAKALAMLKADRFRLYAQVNNDHFVGVVKSQTSSDLVYSCRLNHDGTYACCTQNLNICGGLRGSLCKHLLVLIVGLAKSGELDPNAIDTWIRLSKTTKPALDKDAMSETFLRYKGAEAGEVDWRPTETIPEDYYAM